MSPKNLVITTLNDTQASFSGKAIFVFSTLKTIRQTQFHPKCFFTVGLCYLLFRSWRLLNYNVQYSTKVNTEKAAYKNKSLDHNRYKNLIEVAMKTFCIFGSTYICEQTFSFLNKNKQRSSLTDNHLEDI